LIYKKGNETVSNTIQNDSNYTIFRSNFIFIETACLLQIGKADFCLKHNLHYYVSAYVKTHANLLNSNIFFTDSKVNLSLHQW